MPASLSPFACAANLFRAVWRCPSLLMGSPASRRGHRDGAGGCGIPGHRPKGIGVSLTAPERETVINFSDADDTATIHTHQRRIITKLRNNPAATEVADL
jgi:hypothetical protein